MKPDKELEKEYYILAGIKGLKKELIEKGIETDSMHLLIIKENSVIGKLIKEEAIKEELKQEINNQQPTLGINGEVINPRADIEPDPPLRVTSGSLNSILQEDLCECGHCYANHNIEENYCWEMGCGCKKFKPKIQGVKGE